LSGANSIFFGEKLLTTANNDCLDDLEMLREIGALPTGAAETAAE